jgi:hypothetical protein
MKLLRHYERQLRLLLQPFIYSGDFPAAEAARILLYLGGESEETIMSLGPDEVTKAARQRLFDEAEGKWLKSKARNQRAYAKRKAKETSQQGAQPQQPEDTHEQVTQ